MTRDDEYDAFGRPIERRDEESETRHPEPSFLPPSEQAPAQGGFLPPTEQPPERDAWWAEPAAPAPAQDAPGVVTARTAGEPAEWVARVGAAVLDFLVRLAIVVVAGLVGALAYIGGQTAGDVGLIVGIGIGAIAGLAYAPWMIATRNGQTIGHRATDTRIVKTDGSPLTGGGAVVREVLVKAILFDNVLAWFTFAIGPLLNYLWPLWDDRNEALHDKMCNTRVVKA